MRINFIFPMLMSLQIISLEEMSRCFFTFVIKLTNDLPETEASVASADAGWHRWTNAFNWPMIDHGSIKCVSCFPVKHCVDLTMGWYAHGDNMLTGLRCSIRITVCFNDTDCLVGFGDSQWWCVAWHLAAKYERVLFYPFNHNKK